MHQKKQTIQSHGKNTDNILHVVHTFCVNKKSLNKHHSLLVGYHGYSS